MGLGTIAGVVALIVAGVASALAAGGWLWERSAREARTRLDAQRLNPVPKRVSSKDFEGLPQPVQRYFRTVLTDGQPVVASARIAHRGELKTVHLRPGGERGKARFRLGGPIRMVPGLPGVGATRGHARPDRGRGRMDHAGRSQVLLAGEYRTDRVHLCRRTGRGNAGILRFKT